MEAAFHKVLRFEAEIEVRLRVERVGNTSITYACEIASAGETRDRGPAHGRARR